MSVCWATLWNEIAFAEPRKMAGAGIGRVGSL
jgi:hypothetical protein